MRLISSSALYVIDARERAITRARFNGQPCVFLRVAKEGRGDAIKIFARRNPGDAGCVRDYVFVADVVRANLLAAEAEGACGEAFNIAGGSRTTVNASSRLLRKRKRPSISRKRFLP